MTVVLTMGCRDNNVVDKDGEIIDEGTVEDIPTKGGEVILPLTNFKTLNPLVTDNSYYYQFSKLIFEGMFELDDNLEPIPKLVKSYDISDGGRTISIEIKDNIRWHDGTDFTVDDIAFTIDTIKAANGVSLYNEVFLDFLDGFGNSNLNNIINYRIIDNSNIEIRYDKSYGNNLKVLTFPIIPKHRFNDGSGGNIYAKALDENNYRPIGTGPYKFVDYEKYKNVKLISNEDYWGGEPYITSIVGSVFEDEELILTAFETGQISFAPTIGVDWDKYKQNNRIKVLEYTSSEYEFLGFNFNSPLFSGENGTIIRQAINYGIDRHDIIQKVFLGHGTQIDVPIHPNSNLISTEGYVYGYDRDKANELLKKAGYIEYEDGILRDEQGAPLTLRLTTNGYNPYRLRVAQLIVENLKELGINVITEFNDDYKEDLDEAVINQDWENTNNKIQNGNFDIALLGWEVSAITDLSKMFHSSSISRGTNFIKYSNEDLDKFILDTYYSSNKEENLNSYKEIQKLIIKELPYVSLFFKNRGLLIDTKIVGDLNPSFYNFYNGLEKCYITKNLQ